MSCIIGSNIQPMEVRIICFFSSSAGGLLDQADHELRKDGPLWDPGSQGHPEQRSPVAM